MFPPPLKRLHSFFVQTISKKPKDKSERRTAAASPSGLLPLRRMMALGFSATRLSCCPHDFVSAPIVCAGVVCSQFRSRSGGWRGVVSAAARADLEALQVIHSSALAVVAVAVFICSDSVCDCSCVFGCVEG